jgi:xanthine dehydrogenase accessory factor
MIGSRRKVISIYKELQKEGLSPTLFERVTAPIGLEIGAVTPEEIAVSVVAEMIAFKRGANVSPLQKRHAVAALAFARDSSPQE